MCHWSTGECRQLPAHLSRGHAHTSKLREDISTRLREPGLTGLVCDLEEVESFDTAGVALLRELEERCTGLGLELTLQNVPHAAQPFLGHQREATDQEPSVPEEVRFGWITRLGRWTEDKVSSLSALIEFLGSKEYGPRPDQEQGIQVHFLKIKALKISFDHRQSCMPPGQLSQSQGF
ncbi:MAG: STAS domain-containing protein [Desulfovermiculus sp.]